MSATDPIQQLIEYQTDASILLDAQTLNILYVNQPANILLTENTELTELIQSPNIRQYIQNCINDDTPNTIILPRKNTEDAPTQLKITPYKWEQCVGVILTFSQMPSHSDNDANILMKILEKDYFSISKISISKMSVQIMQARIPFLSFCPHFPFVKPVFELYAQTVVHPADREIFLNTFDESQLKRYAQSKCSPSICIRHLHDGLYRWADFSIQYIDKDTLLFLGKDANEERLKQERTERFQEEIDSLTLRNNYILSGVSDIFRLMLHIDLATGDTVICTAHKSLLQVFNYNTVYPFEEISELLLSLVHPDDCSKLREFSNLSQFRRPTDEADSRIMLEYRRISPQKSRTQHPQAKWTRSTIHLANFENGIPQTAFYIVQDIHEQKLRELENQMREKTLSDQFYLLLQHRYLWFLNSDYSEQLTTCWKIDRNSVSEYTKCPFSRLFEVLIIPFCHPEDIKKLATLFLPDPVKKAFYNGQRKIVTEFRLRVQNDWHWVRIEMDLLSDDAGSLRSLAYICDIDNEKQQHDEISMAEHNQLVLRRKFGKAVGDIYIRVGEIDLNADKIYHYKLDRNDFLPEADSRSFTELSLYFAGHIVHPNQRAEFERTFSYAQLLCAARENVDKIEQRFQLDLDENKHYIWCNVLVRFFCDDNGKNYAMALIQNIDNQMSTQNTEIQNLEKSRNHLQTALRNIEQSKIRKAHIFSNIAADLKLSINRLDGILSEISQIIPNTPENSEKFDAFQISFHLLTRMIENATDIMMLENAQLRLLSDKTKLPILFDSLKLETSDAFIAKKLNFSAYTTNVYNEEVFCDSARIRQLIKHIFINMILSLPDESKITLNLTQLPSQPEKNTAVYEFTMIASGDESSLKTHRKLFANLQKSPHSAFSTRNLEPEQILQEQSIYICRKLIAMMDGSIDFSELPDDCSRITLRLPLRYADHEGCLFPLLQCYGKNVIIWEPDAQLASSLNAMLSETELHLHNTPDFNGVKESLDHTDSSSFDLLIVRQKVLNQTADFQMADFQKLVGNTIIFILEDADRLEHTRPDSNIQLPHYLKTPLFRSTLAKELCNVLKS